jgi:stearoyl-CoA desaturase (delta-9 desaturase)
MAIDTIDLAAPSEVAAPPEVRGVIRLTQAQLRLQRRITLLVTLIPFAGVGLAIWGLWGVGIHLPDLILFLAFYAATGVGITVGYHRLFTHRSFRAMRPVRIVLALFGSLAVEGSVVDWSATHRRHHAFADQYGDPHSPHLAQAAGFRGVVMGLWHAHSGWLFDDEATRPEEYAPDLLADPDIRRISGWFPHLTVLTFILPAMIGFAISGTLGGAFTAFLWGSLVRVFLLHHVTWSINSICHFYGREAYRAKDESKNVWALSPISFGESWHNNHHAFPWSARLGIGRWQIDVGWYVIRALSAARLIRDVKVPTAEQLAKRKLNA